MNNLQYFWDLTVRPRDLGLIVLFQGYVFVSNIMEKRLIGFA